MRRLDENPIDPEIGAALDAIDATLAGEPVDPRHADLAELALLLAAERPDLRPEFARSLDERVATRFAAPAPATGQRVGASRRRLWLWGPAASLAAAAVVAIAVLSNGTTSAPPTVASSSRAPVPAAKAAPAAKGAPARPSASSAASGS